MEEAVADGGRGMMVCSMKVMVWTLGVVKRESVVAAVLVGVFVVLFCADVSCGVVRRCR